MAKRNLPTGALIVRMNPSGEPRYRANWRDRNGKQHTPTIGPAWLERDGDTWTRRKGRVPEGHFDEKRAHVRMAELIEAQDLEARSAPKRADATFDDAAAEWLDYVVNVKRIKPGTERGYRELLATPGPSRLRGKPKVARIMHGFSGRKLDDITTAQISRFLLALDREGLAARNVNRYRQVLHAIFAYACKPDTTNLPINPVSATEKRREPGAGAIETFTPEEIAAIERMAGRGEHRTKPKGKLSRETIGEMERMDRQDAALFTIAAFTGLRQGELRALRWRNVDFAGQRLTVEAAVSGGTITTPKSGKIRTVPIAPEVVAHLDRLSQREHFTRRDDLVFCSMDGGILNESALRRRFKMAQAAAGIRHRRFHDLRHTFGSMAVRTFNIVEVQAMMGHSAITTTQRYLHAKPRPDDAARISQAFQPDPIVSDDAAVLDR